MIEPDPIVASTPPWPRSRAGAVVAVPTDTVYGLAVDPTCPVATDALFALKARPEALDLPVLVGSFEQAEALAGPGRSVRRGPPSGGRVLAGGSAPSWCLAAPGWTGPSAPMPAPSGCALPDHAVARALCGEVGAAGDDEREHARRRAVHRRRGRACAAFGSTLTVVDGGRCAGAPSTVVSVLDDDVQCLREGAVAWARRGVGAGGARPMRLGRRHAVVAGSRS